MKLDLLAIAAHPDDVELGCAGTLLAHALQGQKVGVIDLTRGELGTRGTAETRAAEAAASTAILGLHARENLGLADGFFENAKPEQLAIIRAIRKYQPEVVLANAFHDRHPDHGRAAKLIADSCFLAGLRKVETLGNDGLPQAAWRPKQVFHFIQDTYQEPTLVVDISAVIQTKIEAIKCFKTQFLAEGKDNEPQTYISSAAFFESVLHRNRMFGKMIGVEYAEGFTTQKVIGIKNFQNLLMTVS
ncbi:bacillithiol biosynthesis deacetylase BshB1 [Chitinophaga costaii]|uniref:Bacillithiol biosynthesis deacetylase BshB1 n=1 Tax=Chitinophaga costaii TaxID=1335309 RepID=A0A1C4CFU8_9BACT|nr:bacillithiol biosynthesis deacetylase BshB1 [Chitinophaga costaii]PUZ27107.1 bacillithiol biosynthesis deacetylase BshB1 [Chitinophaga costaii]SCC17903.1 bacillithiol biosynthesis deacetylase BshB1 [Chitinophaga costaii]